MRILILDDQRSARRVLRDLLAGLEDIEFVEASSYEEAKDVVQKTSPELALVDIRLSAAPGDRGGLDFLSWLRRSGSTLPSVVVTASTELAEVREAMRQGAQDYVLKDELCREMLEPVVLGFIERLHLRSEVTRLRERVDKEWGTAAIVGSSAAIERVRKLITRVADADCLVLIRGETGTGKELVARALHHSSARRDAPFVAVNCSALPGTLIESMIFGHERGAFTGAEKRQRGQLELAGPGTLLLDEIAEMSIELQAKLLRVLEDRRFRPLGSETEVPLKARVLASTHVDIEKRIREGRFRDDLYYRLNVVSISLPPLVERREDIPELVLSMVSDLPRKLQFGDRAVDWLCQRPWPGNVRELRNAIARLALLADSDRIDVGALEEIVGGRTNTSELDIDTLARSILALPEPSRSKLGLLERAVIRHALELAGGNKSAAARLMGVNRRALERRLTRMAENEDGDGFD